MIVRFAPHTEFTTTLKSRVATYVSEQDSARVRRRMLTKTFTIFAWALLSYGAFVLFASQPWHTLVLAISMGLAAAGIGMSIMHDANHEAYPVGKGWRRALGWSLDVLGGSSYIWRFQHNVNHHTFTNIDDADRDISIGAIARLSPTQPRRAYHRFQHIYLWPMYSFLALSWIFWADWRDYSTSSIGSNRFPRPKGREALLFWGGKLLWVVIWIALPLISQPWWAVALFGVVTFLVTGLVLSVIFQMAHVVEHVEFPEIDESSPRSESEFFAHQVATTADFAQGNRLLGWYLGGLNFQIEHHLFPKLCHLHYPGVAKIVRETCREYGMPYHSYDTLFGAMRSHGRWLHTMGTGVTA
ncbi:MAG: acyl-CoA desaturase [Myxococcota bacterium]